MTRYAYEPGAGALVASWGTGRGDMARTIARLPEDIEPEVALAAAAALTKLSEYQWRTYTHPASAAGDPEVPNSIAWHRAQERNRFGEVEAAVREPNLPDEDGMMAVSYSVIEEAAHRVGRVAHLIGDTALVELLVAEVRTEQAAIEAAELGDLSGRARQAVELSRADISPVQAHAADALLYADPLATIDRFTDMDPAAAAVAAARWLYLAAQVAAEAAEVHPVHVVAEADNLEALQVETPTLVLERLSAGESPTEVVVDLIADALAAAEGRVRNPARIVEAAEAIERRMRGGEIDEDGLTALTDEFRISRLDPARPAVDLLEDLLAAIRGCLLLYCEEYGSGFEDAVRAEADNRGRPLL
ncbi:hypothetical protein [Nocardia veterana]|uniref:Uncharacterized protein n=1 Tax=Nocardia veterana TaxID=132249 RepID=A0A7X6RHY4_9NOCA|nr:hypothetical protein [Nocardia veterana]NKY86063.1 hypothetical protein [Nocardia veterana]